MSFLGFSFCSARDCADKTAALAPPPRVSHWPSNGRRVFHWLHQLSVICKTPPRLLIKASRHPRDICSFLMKLSNWFTTLKRFYSCRYVCMYMYAHIQYYIYTFILILEWNTQLSDLHGFDLMVFLCDRRMKNKRWVILLHHFPWSNVHWWIMQKRVLRKQEDFVLISCSLKSHVRLLRSSRSVLHL